MEVSSVCIYGYTLFCSIRNRLCSMRSREPLQGVYRNPIFQRDSI